MKKWDIFSRFCHLFKDFWEREWCGEVDFGYTLPEGYDPYGRPLFVWAERCRICGKLRIRYKDGLGYTRTPDVDRVILAAKGQIPYSTSSHKKLTPDS